MITEDVRAETMAKLEQAKVNFASELALIAVLDSHRIIQNDNLGYYRSGLHCSCAAEWWAGEHEGDPGFGEMWAMHRAEVISGFLADRQPSGGRFDVEHIHVADGDYWAGCRRCYYDRLDGIAPLGSETSDSSSTGSEL
ncbi:MAG: hypothetical protein JWP85_2109 [Rhodoglobus sp.]|nr:hypothetical protein [Rhodoglobus sp.]